MMCVHESEAGSVRERSRAGRRGWFRRAVVSVAAAASVGVGAGVVALPARAATTAGRAAVVVEVDGAIHTGKVTFTGDSITGLDALRAAGFDPLVRVFGGNGGAVCALAVDGTTIGCPADASCLTCDDPNYWGYFRAPAGATSYTYSIAGAGLTAVHDGDVEAWVWGRGSPPSRFVSFRDVWGPDTTTTTRPAPTTRPTTRATVPPTVATLGSVPPSTVAATPTTVHARTTTPAKPKITPTTARPRSSTTDTLVADARTDVALGGRKIAAAPIVARGGSGSPYGLIGFLAILLVLLSAIFVARRRRRAAPAT